MNASALGFSTPPQPQIQSHARIAGILYLVIIACGLSAELLLRGPVLVALSFGVTPPEATLLLRAALVADGIMVVADVALALVFFALLRPVSTTLSAAAMLFRLIQAGFIAYALFHFASVPSLVEANDPEAALALAATHALAYDIGLIFFGVNSLIMARLLCSAGGVPRVIVGGIAISGLVYIAGGLLRLLNPALLVAFEVAYILPMISETALCLWLLITGRLFLRT